jgi:RNA-directed DNA polymerase
MKRYGNLYQRICDADNLARAHANARKGKTHYTAVKMIDADPAFYLRELRLMLLAKKFTTSPYVHFMIHEPKERKISRLPYFPDRIVQHAIMQVLGPIWDRQFIRDSYAAVPGRGIHAGSHRLRQFLRQPKTAYCLKLDIKKFYPNINHDVLMALVERKIKCPDTLRLLENIIRSIPGGKGLPIGNYLSQYLSNIYLDGLDHWLKEKMRCRFYVRYCDDAVILADDKKYLAWLLERIRLYLENDLRLELNRKTRIFPVDSCGVDFLGYKTYRDRVLLRAGSRRRLIKRMRLIERRWRSMRSVSIINSIMSHVGWAIHCDARGLMRKHITGRPDVMAAFERAATRLGLKRSPMLRLSRKYKSVFA